MQNKRANYLISLALLFQCNKNSIDLSIYLFA